jgi:hypothetical protein
LNDFFGMTIDENKISFAFLFYLLRKYWWLVLGISTLIGAATFYHQKQQPSLFVFKTTLETDQPWSKEFHNELIGLYDQFNFSNLLPKTLAFKQSFNSFRLDTLQLNKEARTFQLRLTIEQQTANALIDDEMFLEVIQIEHLQTQSITYTFPTSPILLVREKHPVPITSSLHAFIVSCLLLLFLIAWIQSHRNNDRLKTPNSPDK